MGYTHTQVLVEQKQVYLHVIQIRQGTPPLQLAPSHFHFLCALLKTCLSPANHPTAVMALCADLLSNVPLCGILKTTSHVTGHYRRHLARN